MRPVLVHAARVAVLVGLVAVVHAEHGRRVAATSSADLTALPLARIQRHLPAAAAIGDASTLVAGGREVVGRAGEVVGTILRTSPAGDAAIGFSGLTDVLVVCDADLRVAGMEVLASRDTRDHVRAVERDEAFWRSFAGRTLESLAATDAGEPHAVAGATLTSLAIREAVARRLGGTAAAGRFAR
ncbi:MAG: FMN-binding protein, partial [Planctomycetia bacterium]